MTHLYKAMGLYNGPVRNCILLEVPPPTFHTATMTPTVIGRDNVSHHSPPPTTNSQPSDYAPIIPKPDPTRPKPATTTFTNESRPTTSLPNTNAIRHPRRWSESPPPRMSPHKCTYITPQGLYTRHEPHTH